MQKLTIEQLEFWQDIVQALLANIPLHNHDETYLGTVRRYMDVYITYIEAPANADTTTMEKELRVYWLEALGIGPSDKRGQFHELIAPVFLIADRATMEFAERSPIKR